jgi:Protein of unknown function (DUF732)
MAHKLSAYVFGALFAVMVLPAAVAHADATDVEFANYLANHGINLGSPAQAAKVARLLCQDLDAGFSQNDAVTELQKHDLSQSQAEFFVGAATADYCPQHRSAPPGS